MSLPPFFYVRRFWEAVAYILSGLLALLALFGVIPAEWAVGSAVILQWALALLRLFGIEPTLWSNKYAAGAKCAKKSNTKK